MAKDERDELEKQRKAYLKKMKRLGEDLTALQRAQRKLDKKQHNYEEKLRKIDDRLHGL